MSTKTCNLCGVEKPISEFSQRRDRPGGLVSRCKVCKRAINAKWRAENPEKEKASGAKYRRNHPEKHRAKALKWVRANPEKVRANAAKWAKANPEKVKESAAKSRKVNAEKNRAKAAERYRANPEGSKARAARWRKANPERRAAYLAANREKFLAYHVAHNRERREERNKYAAERRRADPAYTVVLRLRARVRHAIRGGQKAARTMDLLGCDRPTLLAHLESRFQPGMTWENRSLWHIDHIRPCASFDLLDPEQQRICFHYTNLQPLWAADNLKKSATIPAA